jgi:hypothetical protein
MQYKIPDVSLVAYQASRVASFATVETAKKGYFTDKEVLELFGFDSKLLSDVLASLVSSGKIEETEVTP